MGLRDLAVRALGGTLEQRTGPFFSAANYPSISDTYFGPGRDIAGVVVNERTALSHSVIYAATRFLSHTVSGLKFEAFDEQEDGSLIRSKVQPPIVTDPFAQMPRHQGFGAMVVSDILRGGTLNVAISRDPGRNGVPGTGLPNKLFLAHPDTMTLSRIGGQLLYTINGQPVSTEDVFYSPMFTVPGNPLGVGPIEAASGAVALGLAQTTYATKFFENGANLSGVIQVPGELDLQKASRILKVFSARHSGVTRSHAVGLLSGGAEFKTISITPEQSQLLASRAFSANELAMLIGVPAELLGLPSSTYLAGTGLETKGRGFVTYNLAPYLKRIEATWSRMLPPGQVARFNTDPLTTPDLKARFDVYHIAVSDGIMSINEVRKLEGLPPIDGGDVYLRPLYLGNAATQENPSNTTPTKPSNAITGGTQ